MNFDTVLEDLGEFGRSLFFLHCFKFAGKFQQIDRRVAVQTVYGWVFSGAVFPVDGLGNSGRILLLKLLTFSSPSTGKFQ